MRTCIYIYIHIYIFIFVYIYYIFIYIYIHIYIYIYVYIYLYIYIHIYIYIYYICSICIYTYVYDGPLALGVLDHSILKRLHPIPPGLGCYCVAVGAKGPVTTTNSMSVGCFEFVVWWNLN